VPSESCPSGRDRRKSELRGDSVQIELAELQTGVRARAVLARVPGLDEVSVHGRLVHARAVRGATAVPEVLAALESVGVKVGSVTMARPSLDDVNWAVEAGRSAATERMDWNLIGTRIGLLGALLLLSATLATMAFRAYQRSI
jgi:hypothetical protein